MQQLLARAIVPLVPNMNEGTRSVPARVRIMTAFAGLHRRLAPAEGDIASRYEGCAFGDATGHQLNDSVATWSHAGSLAT